MNRYSKLKTGLLLVSVLGLSACAHTERGRQEQVQNGAIGAGVGAVAGQLIGHDTEATVTGALIGGAVGSQVHRGW